jgi:UDP-GlcNAc:undecaprenyl-phosphate/decaprenyl-phosphate GlcNAc-1-phosphate transferase
LPNEAQLIAAFGLALLTTLVITPVAIAVASRTQFHDRPVGYKEHARPTPYLGGAAVLGGFLVAALTVGEEVGRLAPIVLGTCGLWLLGTVDDRVGLPAWPRLAAEAGAAIALWSAGLGWDVVGTDAADLALTIVWVVGLVNAFNLIDNMDGAAATLAGVTAVAVGVLALIEDDVALALLVFGLAGACAGFLPYNLSAPARIFLGDGGSLAIGFVIAAGLMALPAKEELGLESLLAAVLLAGLPVLDTSLVMISRRRAGLSIMKGGRDHLTHRLRTRIGTARTVAVILGVVQAGLGAVAVGVVERGQGSVVVAWTIWFVVAMAAIALLETSAWTPVREAAGHSTSGARRRTAGGPARPASLVEAVLIAFISISCGLSPFLYGFYDVSVWGPIALFIVAGLIGLLIARPAVPRRTALVALSGLVVLWLWSLLSTRWAESADQALTEANRWLLYAALFGVLVLLLRDDRLGRLLVGAGTAAILALGLYTAGRMALGHGSELFFGRRLNEPLGYANGQAGYLLLGLWPLIAVAERVERLLAAGLAVAATTLLAGLVVLSQTRAVIPAVLLSGAVLLAVVPGRARRLWALTAVAAGVGLALGPLLEVYDGTPDRRVPSEDVLQTAGITLLLAAAAVGAAWSAACAGWRFAAPRLPVKLWRALVAVPCAVLAAGVVIAVTSVDDPLGRVEREYRTFVELGAASDKGSRFGSGGGNRYDYWRIAAKQFADEPLRGVGAGNYDRTYFLERRTSEDIRQPHSIELQALGELGLVGGLAVGLFVVGVLAGFWRRTRASRDAPGGPVLAVAAGGTFLVWVIHTSVDWLHMIPGVTGLALCSAAVLVGPWRGPPELGTGIVQKGVIVLCGLTVLFGAVLMGRSALAERYRAQAQDAVASEPARAVERANDSLSLNDEALQTYYVKAAAYARLDDYAGARAALFQASRREPHDFVTWGLLGDLAVRRGDFAAAHSYYRRALKLNPRDATLRVLAREPREAISP